MIIYDKFFGMNPRTSDHLLSVGYAKYAMDINLEHGDLRPFREPKPVANVIANAVTLYIHGCCYLAWDKCVKVTPWVTACDNLIITGRASYPEIAEVGDNCSLQYTRLGVISPDTAPTATSVIQEIGEDVSYTSYVYTFINKFGHESAPSPPSNEVLYKIGEPITVTNFEIPPPEYRIDSIGIYRRETGYRTGEEREQEYITDYFRVGIFPIATSSVLDKISPALLGNSIDTLDVREPPDGITNIKVLGNYAVLVGSVGNKIYFSDSFRPYSFPDNGELTLDDYVIGIEVIDDNVYVATTSNTYIISGDLNCGEKDCRQVHKLPYKLPAISCWNGKGTLSTPFGMAYVSNEGIILVNTNKVTNITDSFFAKDDWVSLRPDTMRLAYYQGVLFCVSESISFVLWLDDSTYARSDYARLSLISDTPIAMEVTSNGELMMLLNGIVYQWEAGDEYRDYIWESAEIHTPFYASYTHVLMHLSGEVKFVHKNSLQESETFISYDGSYKSTLPRMPRDTTNSISISGTGTVKYVRIGNSYSDLTNSR